VHPVATVFVTDDPSVAAAGSSAAGTWAGLLAADLDRDGSPMDVTLGVLDGAGFAPDSAGAKSFTRVVTDSVEPSTQLVFFFETRFGSAGGQAVAQGADQAFKTVEEAAPDALIVVVGPYLAPDAGGPGDDLRDALRDAAARAEAPTTYVDPVAEDWPIGASQQQIADLLKPHVADMVGGLARSGAFD
jgi:hypothetical protein